MSHWVNTYINIGNVRKGKSVVVTFKAKITIPKIVNLEASCGCVKLSYSERDKELYATFKAGNFPNHILEDTLPISQFIKVFYADKTTEDLTLAGNKIR